MKVLQIVGSMHPGGLENFVMNLYQKIDKEKIQFDFVVHARRENDYVDLIESMGGNVYLLPRLFRSPIKNLTGIYKLVKENHYDIVVRHTANALITPQLFAARLAGAKTICHSHNETDAAKVVHYLGRSMMRLAADRRLACSEKAGRWMFGHRKYQVIHNAIDVEKFRYSSEKAESIRKEFGLDDCRVYGHIANFREQKNHRYLIKIYAEIAKRDPNARFFCVGDGELRGQIETDIKQLGLEKKIILTGERKDSEDFMSCFDVLIFPSFFEGLPLTLIEAQAAGLPCLISDTITPDVIVTDGLVQMESIEAEPKEWAVRVMNMRSQDRECQKKKIAENGYDIEALVQWYETYFEEMVKGE